MRLAVLSFGSNWWARSEREISRFARYNSSGIECGRKMRRHWTVPGILRINGKSNFGQWPPQRMLGGSFRASELSFACGGNRLLLVEKSADSRPPEFYLLTISSALHGSLDLSSPSCRSGSSIVFAASQLRERQEIMLLLEPGGWFKTAAGLWQLRQTLNSRGPEIVLLRPLAPAPVRHL
jgi:hypothetical protein